MRSLITLSLLATACGSSGVSTPLIPTTAPASLSATPSRIAVATSTASLRPLIPGELPDPTLTPGEAQTTDLGLICTSPIKVPRDVPISVKMQVFSNYHIPWANRHLYEVDHLIPLELGGANTIANLWPEFGPIPNPKDGVEDRLHALVCTGKVTIEVAQHAIATNWPTAIETASR
jgi:hypothetical protein